MKEFCPFHENTGFTLTLLEKDPQNANSEESSENRETFSVSKFSPATGVRSYGKGTGIVIPIIQTQLWEWEGNRESFYGAGNFFFENR